MQKLEVAKIMGEEVKKDSNTTSPAGRVIRITCFGTDIGEYSAGKFEN